jgi:hypothetical protein
LRLALCLLKGSGILPEHRPRSTPIYFFDRELDHISSFERRLKLRRLRTGQWPRLTGDP